MIASQRLLPLLVSFTTENLTQQTEYICKLHNGQFFITIQLFVFKDTFFSTDYTKYSTALYSHNSYQVHHFNWHIVTTLAADQYEDILIL